MTAYLLRRLLIGIATLLVASVVVFAVLEILPGDPARLMLGTNATEDAVQALREQMGLNQGMSAALSHLGRRAPHLRFRALLHLLRAGHRPHCRARCRIAALGDHCAHPVHRHRHSGRRLRRSAPRQACRHACHGRIAVRGRGAEFLVRAAARLCLRRLAAPGAGRRLSGLERWRLAGAEGADPAGHRTRPSPGGDPCPRHALRAARRSRRGLHPHRPRQGPASAAPCCGVTRFATPCCRY